MDLDHIMKMAQASDALRRKSKSPVEEEDPIKSLMLTGVSAHNPPGSLGEFCDIIGKHFQRRPGTELYRIIGALAAAQVIAGRNILTPQNSKIMFQLMLVAPSGSGKTSMIEFAAHAARELGLEERFRGSTVTSLKQLQMAIIEAGGMIVYMVDDQDGHVLNWDNERSPLDGVSSFFRSESSSSLPWSATSPIKKEFAEIMAQAGSAKMLESIARIEGWILPRIGEKNDIDYKALARMNQDAAKRFAKAKADSDLAQKPIERMKFIPVISMTPDKAKRIVENWKSSGTMGRTFFVCHKDELQGKDRDIPKWDSRSFVNFWKPRMPTSAMTGQWGEGSKERFYDLDDLLDSLRNEGGITGQVATRYGQLMLDMATLCAFLDTSSRTVSDFTIETRHLEWAYQACLESLLSLRDYHEGEPAENGLEVSEWQAILGKVRSCVEGNVKFREQQYVSILSNRICRDRVKDIIDACNSSGMTLNASTFTHKILECVGQYRYAPVERDPNDHKKVRVNPEGNWNDIPMNQEIRNIMTTAMRKMRFMKK